MSRLPANVSRFTFAINGSPVAFRVLAFAGVEGVSQLFEYRIEVLCPHNDLELRDLLGDSALLTLVHSQYPRVIHGMIVAAAQRARLGENFVYEFTLAPQLCSLTKRSGFRIFQEQTVRQIVTQVLQDAGFADDEYSWDLQAPGASRPYCVQYGESEFDFITRLLAEDGIHFHFAHSVDRHCLVLADHGRVFAEIPGDPEIRYCLEDRAARDQAIIRQLRYRQQVSVNRVNLGDYDFQRPRLALRTASQPAGSDSSGFGELEAYHYRIAQCQSEAEQESVRQRLQQSLSCRARVIGFESDDSRLAVGQRFSVKEHPREALNRLYLLLDYEVEGRLPQSAEALSVDQPSEFICRGTAIPSDVVYRPALNPSAPKARGVQTAVVTGPVNNELYTDRYGRIKVQFHWDREGKANEETSCWVRVSQAMAGKEWGAYALPRVGQEVIVTFEEGDPARPLVTGSVYNSVNLPPYPLPAQKSRSGIKTRSAEHGGGFNELRIEDRKEQEKLFLRAERNLDVRVGNRWQQWVKGNTHHQVKGSSYAAVAGDEHQAVQGNLNQQVGQNLSFAAGQDLQLKVSGAQVIQVGNQLHIKGGHRLVIQAGQSLAVKVGGSFISLDPSGVAISGPVVRINEGGGGGAAQNAAPQSPQKPTAPDADNSGQNSKPPQADSEHNWEGLTFQRGVAKAYTLESAARHQAAFVALATEPANRTAPPALTQARKNILAETFAAWANWQDDTMDTFDRIGEDPATPELLRFAVAALKTPARLGTGIVSGAASIGQLMTDPAAREQLADSIVALYENPEQIGDAIDGFVSQPGHEIASDLFALGGEMVLGGASVSKVAKLQKGAPDLAESSALKTVDELDGGFHEAAGIRVLDVAEPNALQSDGVPASIRYHRFGDGVEVAPVAERVNQRHIDYGQDLAAINESVESFGLRALRLSGGDPAKSEELFEGYLKAIDNRLHRVDSDFRIEIQPAGLKGYGRVPNFIYLHRSGPDTSLIRNGLGEPKLFAFPGSKRLDAGVIDITTEANQLNLHSVVAGFDITLSKTKQNIVPKYQQVFGDIPIFDIRLDD